MPLPVAMEIGKMMLRARLMVLLSYQYSMVWLPCKKKDLSRRHSALCGQPFLANLTPATSYRNSSTTWRQHRPILEAPATSISAYPPFFSPLEAPAISISSVSKLPSKSNPLLYINIQLANTPPSSMSLAAAISMDNSG